MVAINYKTKMWFVACSAFSAILAALGKIDVFTFFGLKNPVPLMNGLTLSAVILQSASAVRLFIVESANNKLLEQNAALIANQRSMLVKGLQAALRQQTEFNVRLFLPRKVRFRPGKKRINEIVFGLENLDGFSGFISGLEYRVDPVPEGLVGKCYQTREIVVENELSKAPPKKYNLTKQQRSLTMHCDFCACYPVLVSGDRVIAVVSLDSEMAIRSFTESKEAAVKRLLGGFALNMKESLPHIFKKAEVILNEKSGPEKEVAVSRSSVHF